MKQEEERSWSERLQEFVEYDLLLNHSQIEISFISAVAMYLNNFTTLYNDKLY
jgi:hypothetical protein